MDGNLFSVMEFNGKTPLAQLQFNLASFWVRMYDMPLACMSRAMGERLGSLLGEVEEVETNEDGVGWGEYLRVCVKLNLMKPLMKGRMIKVKKRTHCISFQYEKIPRFCFNCGVICHGELGCLKRNTWRNIVEE